MSPPGKLWGGGGDRFLSPLCLFPAPQASRPSSQQNPPSQVLALRATGECRLLHFAFGVSPGRNRFPLGPSEPQFRPVARTRFRATNFRESGQAVAWGSPDFPSPEGPAGYLWEFILSENLGEFRGIAEVFLDFPFLLPEMQTISLRLGPCLFPCPWPGVSSSASPASWELTLRKGQGVYTNK